MTADLSTLLAALFNGGAAGHGICTCLGVLVALAALWAKDRLFPASKTPVIDALSGALAEYLRSVHQANTAAPPAPAPTATDVKVKSELGSLAPFLAQIISHGAEKPAETQRP